MSHWRIDEQATGQILRSTAACAQQYAASRGDASTAAGSLSDALSNSGIVAAAVAGWMDGRGLPGLVEITERVGVAVTATGEALANYHHGNLAMADNAHTMASFTQSPPQFPGGDGNPYDPSRFRRR